MNPFFFSLQKKVNITSDRDIMNGKNQSHIKRWIKDFFADLTENDKLMRILTVYYLKS